MKRSRFGEEQIVGVLKGAEAGVPVKDLCRRVGISDATFYHWKAKYGGPEVNETQRLRQAGGRKRTAEKDRGAAGVGPRRAEGGAGKKVVGPRAAREAVRVVREEAGLSERRACGLIGMHRGSWRYRRRQRDEAALRAWLRELAAERPRFGYRRLYIVLRREKGEDGTSVAGQSQEKCIDCTGRKGWRCSGGASHHAGPEPEPQSRSEKYLQECRDICEHSTGTVPGVLRCTSGERRRPAMARLTLARKTAARHPLS